VNGWAQNNCIGKGIRFNQEVGRRKKLLQDNKNLRAIEGEPLKSLEAFKVILQARVQMKIQERVSQ
jgi:hypothetical protein